jgi:hypothetical protein
VEKTRDGALTSATNLATLLAGKHAVLLPDDDDADADYWAEVTLADGRRILYMGTRGAYARWAKGQLQ